MVRSLNLSSVVMVAVLHVSRCVDGPSAAATTSVLHLVTVVGQGGGGERRGKWRETEGRERKIEHFNFSPQVSVTRVY